VRRSARDVAAPAYSVLARSGFATLERLAGVDAKHADRFVAIAPSAASDDQANHWFNDEFQTCGFWLKVHDPPYSAAALVCLRRKCMG
jgi:hypothetical protein